MKSPLSVLRRNHVSICGQSKAGQTLVFVHGFGTDQTAWAHLLPAFAADYRIVLFDHVGAGKADGAAYDRDLGRYLNLRGYAADLLEVIEAVGGGPVSVIGHSMGAMIGLLASIERPDLIERLVLIGASPRYLEDQDYPGGMSEAVLEDIHTAMLSDYDSWVSQFAPAVMGNPDRPQLAQYFADALWCIPPSRAVSVLYTIFRSDHRADLARVSVPCLILQTAEDMAVPLGVAEYLQRHIRNSQLRIIDASGHFPHISAPLEVAEAMQVFGFRP